MSRALAARTEAGERMVALAEEHAADFATRAEEHDRENTFVHENFDAMKASGFLAATAPAELGGLGVTSVHDLTVAVSRLARGCPATAIAVNMHLGFAYDMSRTWREAAARGDDETAGALVTLLKLLARNRIVMTHAGTEPGGSALYFPATEGREVDGGYVLNGRKTFATNSAVGDVVTVFLRVPDGAGWYRLATALIPRDTEGLEVVETWDALGMRGSGSHDIVLTDCFVPARMVSLGDPVGEPATGGWPGLLAVNFPLVGTYVGIAEAAHAFAVDLAGRRRKAPFHTLLAERPAIQLQVAEMEVELAAARATLERAADAIDGCLALHDAELTLEGINEVVAEFQCAKLVVNRAAAAVVDRAMTVTGGGAYLSGHLLGRLYRDVRAGPFMQPYAPTEGLEFIGRVSLGLDPYTEVRALAPADAVPAGRVE